MHTASQKNNSGFTLLEIIVVIIIVSALSALAIPRMTGTFERVRASEGVNLLTALLSAQVAFEAENGTYATDTADLDVEITTSTNFEISINSPVVDNPGNPVTSPIAEIRRLNAYWLQINELGQVRCVDAGATFTCAQANVSTTTF